MSEEPEAQVTERGANGSKGTRDKEREQATSREVENDNVKERAGSKKNTANQREKSRAKVVESFL